MQELSANNTCWQRLKEFICEENISLFHDKEAEKNKDINEAAVEDEYSEASGEIPDKKKKEKKAKKSEPVGEAYDDGEEDLTERDDYTEIKK
ncbi:MAG: hypothetical protein IK094_00415 [Treponema sp.]|nr:hypothetical protein [Treponema sp.]